MIPFCVTTCKRFDLFLQTILSVRDNVLDFKKYIDRIIISDDGSANEDIDKMRDIIHAYFDIIPIIKSGQIGHADSLNRLYVGLNSDFAFHCEDDWQFLEPREYIHDALSIMEACPAVGQICFRKYDGFETFNHNSIEYQLQNYIQIDGNLYNGFTLNPCVFRMEALKTCLPFQKIEWFEDKAGTAFHNAKWNKANLNGMYLAHIGFGKSAYELTGATK
jgi:hypothetical protein